MKRVVLLTGSELRHSFFRKFVAGAEGIDVLLSYTEGLEKSLAALLPAGAESSLRAKHVANRTQSEKDFFAAFVDRVDDHSKPLALPKGEINAPEHVERVIACQPDLLVAYGSSIIREPLLSAFPGRFLNVHLGLSPYYRGSGTNYWPLVNDEPEYVGATFMHIDAGVDTGEVIHQIRAQVSWGDTPSQIGNRLILDMAYTCVDVIRKFDQLERMPALPVSANERVYKKKDFTEESVATLYANFANGLVDRFLSQRDERCRAAPILHNPGL
jgi:methionyl-tRNA formyltransferase